MTLSPLPVGGSVLISLYGGNDYVAPAAGTVLTLLRNSTTIYSGPALPFWLDVGDGPSTSSAPLDPNTEFTWQAIDNTGTTQATATPSPSISTVPDGLTQIVIRLLQAACDNAPGAAVAHVQRPQVTTRMPQGGWQASPFVVVNLDLFQQSDTTIGQDIAAPPVDGQWTLWGWARRIWRISVFSQDADERDFYRDTIMVALRALKATLFSQVGMNIRHDFQASSGTTGDEWIGQGPGFYWADVMWNLEGAFPVSMLVSYGTIEAFRVGVTIATP